jgi:Ca2+-binding EF-hand superfamily protein
MNRCMKGLVGAFMGLAAWAGSAQAQDAPDAKAKDKGQAAKPERRDQATADLSGPIDSVEDLNEAWRLLFKLVDLNDDGLISQKEATDAANLLVGGYFFRADANGDGVVSKDEANKAGESFLRQKPFLKAILERIQKSPRSAPATANASNADTKLNTDAKANADAKGDPVKMLGMLLDVNHDEQLQASEVRKAVETAVKGLYEAADKNKDGQLSPAEIDAAAISAARSMANSAIKSADTDQNGSLSQAEYGKAIQKPADMLFRVLDANGDGQVTPAEAKAAQREFWKQIKMIQPPVSARPKFRAGAGEPVSTDAPRTAAATANSPESR